MKTLGRRLIILGVLFLVTAPVLLLLPKFQEEKLALGLYWRMGSSLACGGILLMLGVHLSYKDDGRGV